MRFKDFILESYETVSDEDLDGDRYITHTAKIGPHRLNITHHISDQGDGDKVGNTDFDVDGASNLGYVKNPRHSAAILSTISKSLRDTFAAHKPNSWGFIPASPAHHKAYSKLIPSIAKKLKQSYEFMPTDEEGENGVHVINFNNKHE
jgi:hypothetical protein